MKAGANITNVSQQKNILIVFMNFNYLILSYFDKNKRDLPWRHTKDPFRIWLSEIILQQTRVDQGMKFYNNFIQEFDTIFDLANAEEQKVLKLWQGLGYYSRARNLHYTSKVISDELNGHFPTNFNDLKKLKGIGDYTAAAISSIVYNEAVPAVDGNMFRVFARYFNIEDDISSPKTKKIFWDLGLEIIDKKRPGDFNQAVMDLGATICTPKQPKCEICPLNESCEALRLNKVTELPVKLKKTKVSNRFLHFIIIENESTIAFSKRTGNDVWKNLFTFPKIETETDLLDKGWILDQNLENKLTFIDEEKHVLSHQNLFIKYWKLNVSLNEITKMKAENNFEMISLNDLEDYPLPKPIEKFINKHYLD
ncbi:A/G-specific adenine glycosylase [Empedobacter stercoris]|nr:A/G-specific adenine glycosylase [Empedobacter stercoris]MCA4781099.1 A/G-specific adenine glycosylase [Empedobacter stercoris]MCA4810067.1 A/G-specific adenine glycosylase [Empedobacter stercoris]NOJ76190.1 A/G-specific adenine glycosylase [Empedobacter stercoris]QNT15226.1 A/G-specific adenine glycosylase [Empedobacter stercoris]